MFANILTVVACIGLAIEIVVTALILMKNRCVVSLYENNVQMFNNKKRYGCVYAISGMTAIAIAIHYDCHLMAVAWIFSIINQLVNFYLAHGQVEEAKEEVYQ